jgi:hypothetical protein
LTVKLAIFDTSLVDLSPEQLAEWIGRVIG